MLREHVEEEEESLPLPPWLLLALGGGVATFRARPYAPWKELLSRMRKAPGSRSFRTAMAKHDETQRKLKAAFTPKALRIVYIYIYIYIYKYIYVYKYINIYMLINIYKYIFI